MTTPRPETLQELLTFLQDRNLEAARAIIADNPSEQFDFHIEKLAMYGSAIAAVHYAMTRESELTAFDPRAAIG